MCVLLFIGYMGYSQIDEDKPGSKPAKTETVQKDLSPIEPVVQEQPAVETGQDGTTTGDEPKSSAIGPRDQKKIGVEKSTGSGQIESPTSEGQDGGRSTANNHLRSVGDNHLNLNSGRLGVGTNTPYFQTKLHVTEPGNFGDIMIEDDYPFLYLEHASPTGNCGVAMNLYGTGTTGWMFLDFDGTYPGLRLSTSSSGYRDDLLINPDGKVGIGTGDPQQQLHVNGIGQFDLGTGTVSVSTPGGWPGIIAYENTLGYRRDIIFDDNAIRLLVHANSTAPPPSHGVSITNNGAVGIGINFPTDILHCYSNDITPSIYDDIVLESNNWPYIIINNLETSGYAGFFVKEQGITKALFRYDGVQDIINLSRSGGSDFIIANNGNIGIGTTNAVYKLTVYGGVKAQEFWATLTGWPDYVLEDDYKLQPLGELEQYIKENRHLPDIPTEKEILENGLNLGEMEVLIMKKIEELTLYIIDQQKQIDMLKQENEELKSVIRKED